MFLEPIGPDMYVPARPHNIKPEKVFLHSRPERATLLYPTHKIKFCTRTEWANSYIVLNRASHFSMMKQYILLNKKM